MCAATPGVLTPGPATTGDKVLQGAFTLRNMHTGPAAEITAELPGIAAGTADRPVRGSGVFVPPGARIMVQPTAQTQASFPLRSEG
jgi:hypothetical protein